MTRHLLVIGAQRCGTTYVASLLDSHPDVTLARPARPEPKVFCSAESVSRGLAWYHRTYFAHATTEEVWAEKSTSYLESADAAERARCVLGAADIVVVLRDPVARAVSNWRLSSASGLEDRPLEAALSENLVAPRPWDTSRTSVSPFAYLERGHYVDQLGPWCAAFPGAVRVSLLEDLVSRESAVGELYARLGVDDTHRPPDRDRQVNQSEGTTPELSAPLLTRLRGSFRDSDARLSAMLGRELPWPSVAGPRRSA